MKLHWKRNAISSLAVLLISCAYFLGIADQVPNEHKIVINIVLAPIFLGLIGGFLFRGTFIDRLAYISPIPIFIVLLLGGDPAKPGLELFLIAPLLIFFIFGLGIAYLISTKVSEKVPNN